MKKLIKLQGLSACFLFLIILFVSGCSDSNNPPPAETEPQSTVTSPARFADIDSSHFLVTDYITGVFELIEKSTLVPQKKLKLVGQATGIVFYEGRYFVGNRATRSVDVLDAHGNFLYHLGGRTGEFSSINDIEIDPDAGVVFVLDTKEAVVRLFYVDGEDTGVTIGAGVLKRPTGLALDDVASTIIVSDFGDPPSNIPPTLWVLEPFSGAVIDSITGGKATFSTPQGMSVDSGYLYVVDALSGEVRVFRLSDHASVKVIGSLGKEEGQLHYPLDVLVDNATKDVFVADNRNSRITVFRGEGVMP